MHDPQPEQQRQSEHRQSDQQRQSEHRQSEQQRQSEHQQPEQPQQPDDFAARTAAAEALPLPERADAFATLHDDLRTRLESGQPPQGHSSGPASAAAQVWGERTRRRRYGCLSTTTADRSGWTHCSPPADSCAHGPRRRNWSRPGG
ncbi:hypothetical protein [Curtobacterium sp. TXMA1]|uniref:hypothetical protein n=1 Tax=Curtobacterium sp. TXMA1 TaxID=2876939 RepID=UPI001CCC2E17|nr:hypothetical protein [Curtobacterium sp. TXMA1]UBQ02109.1 hypothetical protein LCG91_13750 [Curtobacterium sp. TXMA1]